MEERNNIEWFAQIGIDERRGMAQNRQSNMNKKKSRY